MLKVAHLHVHNTDRIWNCVML